MARLGLEAEARVVSFLDGLGVGILDESRRLSVKKSSLAEDFRKACMGLLSRLAVGNARSLL